MEIGKILGYISFVGLFMMVSLIVGVLIWAVNNDYVLFELVNASSTLESGGHISSGINTAVDSVAEANAQLLTYFDWIFILGYVTFFGATVGIAYLLNKSSEFGFLVMLLYGVMLFLFVLSVTTVLTDWFSTNVLYEIVPNMEGEFPKFDWYFENIGLISFVHMLLCLFANQIDLNMIKSKAKKDVEFTDSDEVL